MLTPGYCAQTLACDLRDLRLAQRSPAHSPRLPGVAGPALVAPSGNGAAAPARTEDSRRLRRQCEPTIVAWSGRSPRRCTHGQTQRHVPPLPLDRSPTGQHQAGDVGRLDHPTGVSPEPDKLARHCCHEDLAPWAGGNTSEPVGERRKSILAVPPACWAWAMTDRVMMRSLSRRTTLCTID
jgi:hypothetical protein